VGRAALRAQLDGVIGGRADACGKFGVLGAELVLGLGLGLAPNGDPVPAAVWLDPNGLRSALEVHGRLGRRHAPGWPAEREQLLVERDGDGPPATPAVHERGLPGEGLIR
jgi:hypothetical protein